MALQKNKGISLEGLILVLLNYCVVHRCNLKHIEV